MATQLVYPARLQIAYPERLDRLTTFLRLIWAIPILVILTHLIGWIAHTATTAFENRRRAENAPPPSDGSDLDGVR